jgi:hypothetical protein
METIKSLGPESNLLSETFLCCKKLSFWVVVCLLSILFFLPYFRPSLEYDFLSPDVAEGLYHVREFHLGRIPYKDIYNHHFLGYLLPLYFIEFLMPINAFIMGILAICFNVLTAFFNFKTASLISSKNTARITALISVTFGWFSGWDGHVFNLQSFIILPLSLLIFMILKASLLRCSTSFYLSAFVFSIILTFDQRNIFFILLLILPFLTTQKFRTLRYFTLFSLVSTAIPMFFLALFWHWETLENFFDATFIYPFIYRNFGLADPLYLRLKTLFWNAAKIESFATISATIGFIFLLLFEKRRIVKLLIITGLLSCFAYASTGGRVYGNYVLVFAPFIAILISLAGYYPLLSPSKSPWKKMPIILLCVIIASYSSTRLFHLFTSNSFIQEPESISLTAGKFISSVSKKDADILVWGYKPEIYLYSDRFSSFDEIGLISIAGANFSSKEKKFQGINPKREAAFKSYLKKSPPDFFVYYSVKKESKKTAGDLYQENFNLWQIDYLRYLTNLIEKEYVMIKSFDWPAETVEIYQKLN